jgi:hypothetical protein
MSVIEESDGRFDDAPQWYRAVLTIDNGGIRAALADEHFIVACGQAELWHEPRMVSSKRALTDW